MGILDIFKRNKKYSFISNVITNLPNGLKDDEINEFSNLSQEKLGCELPADYRDFLSEINGFSYNGLTIFSKFNDTIKQLSPRAKAETRDIICWNEKYYDMTDITDYIILGKSDIDYIAYDKEKNIYVILTNGTMDEKDKSENFEELLKRYSKDYLK